MRWEAVVRVYVEADDLAALADAGRAAHVAEFGTLEEPFGSDLDTHPTVAISTLLGLSAAPAFEKALAPFAKVRVVGAHCDPGEVQALEQ